MSYPDLPACEVWPGVRRAGLPEAEPGADAGPAAPRSGGAALFIYGRIRQ